MSDKHEVIRAAMQVLDYLKLGDFQSKPDGLQRDKFMVHGDNASASRLTTRPDAKGGFIRVKDDSLLIRDPSPELRSLILEKIDKVPRKSGKGIEYGIGQLDYTDISNIFEVITQFALPNGDFQRGKKSTELHRFEDALASIIGKPSAMRPFVCDGSPLNAEIFIVGFNPNTKIDFWNFWDGGIGFAKTRWSEAYRIQRVKDGKARSKSNTRSMIDWIIDDIPSARIVETNIYSTATNASADLPTHERNSAAFRFLLNEIKPQVILAHGDDAASKVRKLLSEFKLSAHMIEVEHLRNWGRDKAKDYADRIKRALQDDAHSKRKE